MREHKLFRNVCAPLCVSACVHFIINVTPRCLSVQIIQRQLEQVEEKQRQLEERGVAVEKALRGEAGNNLSLFSSYIYLFFPLESGHPNAV